MKTHTPLSSFRLMNQLLATVAIMVMFGFSYPSHNHHLGRCTGSAYCSACSNCSQCKYCNAGGTCGVCAPPKTIKPIYDAPSAKSQTYTGQCQATTKKGARCKRAARSNGYCWQHGG